MSDSQRAIQQCFPSPRKLFTPAVTAILVLLVAGYTLFSYATDFTINHLAITGRGLLSGKIWQLITYSFINGCGRSLVFNGLLLLFIGSTIERQWRTGAFVTFFLVVSCVCGLIWALLSLILNRTYVGLGTSACGYGLIGAFGVLFYRQRVMALFWTVEAQYIAWFLIVVGIVLGIPQPITWVWVSGAGVAYLYIKLRQPRASKRMTSGPVSRQNRGGGFVDID